MFGTPISGPKVTLSVNENGLDGSLAPRYKSLTDPTPLPTLAPGESTLLTWDHVQLPQYEGRFPLRVRIDGNSGESNSSNDEVTRYFIAQ